MEIINVLFCVVVLSTISTIDSQFHMVAMNWEHSGYYNFHRFTALIIITRVKAGSFK